MQWIESEEMAIWESVASNVGLDWKVSACSRLAQTGLAKAFYQ